jgi:hypothetical protein
MAVAETCKIITPPPYPADNWLKVFINFLFDRNLRYIYAYIRRIERNWQGGRRTRWAGWRFP